MCEHRHGSYKLTTHKKVGEHQDTRKPTDAALREGSTQRPWEETNAASERSRVSVTMLAANVQCVGVGGDCRGHTARGGDGGLTLLVPSLSGCGGFSVTTWGWLGLLHGWARLLWLWGWGRGLRWRLAYLPSGRGLCEGRGCSLRYGGRWRWTRGVGGSRRRSCGSACWTVCSGVALLRGSEALHDGGDPHGFLQEDTWNLNFHSFQNTLQRVKKWTIYGSYCYHLLWSLYRRINPENLLQIWGDLF